MRDYNLKYLALCSGLTTTNFPKTMNAELLFANAPKFRLMSSDPVAKESFESVLK